MPPIGSRDWYIVTEAGFNYVDERCDRYITDLFISNRERDKAKGFAVLADKVSGAMLAATGASTTAIVVTAQAFGFAEGSTDLVANSYLFQVNPANIQNLVAQMRRAYRQRAYQDQAYYTTPTMAYHAIQKYLELCLPQTIESKINDIVARTKAFPDTTAPVPSISVVLGADPPLNLGDATDFQGLPPVSVASPRPAQSPSPAREAAAPTPRQRFAVKPVPAPSSSDDEVKQVLNSYLYRDDGSSDPARQRQLEQSLARRGIAEPIGVVLFGSEFAAQRAQLARDAHLLH